MRVTAPDGREWEVSRRLRWPRLRRMRADDWSMTPVDIGYVGDGMEAGA